MYADDTTMYCVGKSVDQVTTTLNKASVITATKFMYADDTTMYCVGKSVDQVTTTLNKASEELAL